MKMIPLPLLIYHHEFYECSFDILKENTVSSFKGNTKICYNDLFNLFIQSLKSFFKSKLIVNKLENAKYNLGEERF